MVAGGRPSPTLTDQDIEIRRAQLYDYWRWACGHPEESSVGESHPRYVEVTEGRDFGAGYSSCADLAHAGYSFVGDQRAWINRGRRWRPGVNVWRIVEQSKPWQGEARPGDVLVVANDWVRGRDSHVVCVLGYEGGVLDSAEYGQPGGALKRATIRNGVLSGRKIRTRLNFAEEIRRAFHAGLLGPAGEPR